MGNFKWPREVLKNLRIPEDDKEYLATVGLPEFCGNPWMEFGLYESDQDFVIGQSADCPIILTVPDGSIVIENTGGIRMHVNRSISHLGRFLEIWCAAESVRDARKRMDDIAPESIRSGDSCLWGQVLDYEEGIEYTSQEAEQDVTPNA